jgi:hypothetical protein
MGYGKRFTSQIVKLSCVNPFGHGQTTSAREAPGLQVPIDSFDSEHETRKSSLQNSQYCLNNFKGLC